jgi:K+-transporting ATPase ATPase C chain
MKTMLIAVRATLVTLILTGLGYPLAMTGVAQIFFSHAANGSLVQDEGGKVVGSRLIGQVFANPAYFQGRPSNSGYDGANSGGSNFGPASAKLRDRMKTDAARLRKENPEAPGLIPAELVTASASGLDPHLSPEAARWQVARVARARNLAPERVHSLLDEQVEGRDLGIFAERTVNVLLLNLALDRQFGRPTAVPSAATATTGKP